VTRDNSKIPAKILVASLKYIKRRLLPDLVPNAQVLMLIKSFYIANRIFPRLGFLPIR
jgi:hypothetical protein